MNEFDCKIKREDFEICDQPHKMYAEGCQDLPLNEQMIQGALRREGYIATSISIWVDSLQCMNRWSADIELIKGKREASK